MAFILIFALFVQADFGKSLDDILGRLKASEIAVRDEARRDLAALVKTDRKTALPALRDRLPAEKDPEVKATIEWALGLLAAFDDVKMEVVVPEAVTLGAARGRDPFFAIKITNGNDGPVRLYRSWSIEVLDARGEAVKPSTRLGRWGDREARCFLSQHSFLELGAGKSMELKESLAWFDASMQLLTGYKLPGPGDYTIRIKHVFKREAFRAMCRDGCKDHDAAGKAWNLALEGERTFEAKLTVKD